MSSLDRTNEEGQLLLARVTAEWQPLEPILVEMMGVVGIGRADRRYAKMGRINPVSDSERVRVGKRTIVRDSLNSQRRAGRVETTTIDGVEYVRAKSAVCAHCGQDPSGPTASSQPPSAPKLASKTRRKTLEPVPQLAQVIPLVDRQTRDLWRAMSGRAAQ